jgi:sec-independent protein translocase protein TatA
VHPVLAEIFGVDGIIVLVVVVVVLFGGTQIPKLARSLGSAQSQFKKGLEEGKSETTETGSDKAASTEGDGPSASKG